VLSERSIRLTRRLGQHLLVDQHYLQTVIDHSDFAAVDLVLEVGPGPGNLTERLIERANRVISVELDQRFCEILRQKFYDRETFTLMEKSILAGGKLDPEVVASVCEAERWGLSANLPYNVGSIVMVESLYLSCPPAYMCVMIQKEVARRLAGEPGSKDYGVLSVLAQALAEVKIVTSVPPGAFLPPPKVHSAIVQFIYRPELAARVASKGYFRQAVSRLFRHRRKTLRGGWVKMLEKDQQGLVESILTDLEIDMSRRAETLSVGEFVALANRLFEAGIVVD
jgi:16S rRNA (adenine1518-N6/adenine1519-N6)-dimethyltransferase